MMMLSNIMIKFLEYLWIGIAAVVYASALIRAAKDIKASYNYDKKRWYNFLNESTVHFIVFNILAVFVISFFCFWFIH